MTVDKCESIVEDVMKRGAKECEACIEDTVETIITLDRGFVHGKRKKRSTTFGLRTLLDGKKGFVAGSLPVESLDEIKKASLHIARTSVPDTTWKHLPYPRGASPVNGIYDRKLASVPFETLREDITTMINTADEPDITIDSGRISCVVKDFSICNSHGASCEYTSTRLTVHFVVRCGVSESTWGVHHSRQYDCDFVRLAEETVEQARVMSTPRMLHSSFTGDAVFLAEPVEDILLAPLRSCFNAETVGRTRFAHSFGEKVASDEISIRDDGTFHRGIHTSPVDGECNPTQKTDLIKKGILCSLLHSEYTANKQGILSTGNGVRRAVTEPAVGITNLILKRGRASTDELIQEVRKGVLIGDFSGNVDPISGLFSGVMEHTSYIEKGEIRYPVTGAMICGNIFDLLNNVSALGEEEKTGETGMYTVPALIKSVDVIVR